MIVSKFGKGTPQLLDSEFGAQIHPCVLNLQSGGAQVWARGRGDRQVDSAACVASIG